MRRGGQITKEAAGGRPLLLCAERLGVSGGWGSRSARILCTGTLDPRLLSVGLVWIKSLGREPDDDLQCGSLAKVCNPKNGKCAA